MKPAAPLVFITGASSGIGQALAERYLADGWRLALVARRGEALQAWRQAAGVGPERCSLHVADVTDAAAMARAAQDCLQHQGLPEVVIANAGISIGMDPAEAEDLGVLQQLLATNVAGLAATLQPFVTPMVQRGHGRLVGVASVAGVRGLPGHAAYCASKAAVISYCESLRSQLAGSGVRVLTLCPGFVATPLTARNRYAMPFLLDAPEFALRARRAIAGRASYCVIPWQMGLLARLLPLLPNRVFDRLMAAQPRKRRAGE
ncbi:SDR family oxidoreductase [Comamonas sp. NLF-1-9]|uniref:SDR family oxidoreductase n=1 Tax=Comamonas sp. NLF-1-9 TaxID=2853163 RepID=UPI001C46D5CD|nr:SDR family oxidoreductase [Comamonas sp. NLF-1-9]QXL83765.1 SDR family oxidoreductase [Comamonas sp. NLF-1-9]